MSQWFGDSWGAPCCDPEEHVATPVRESCGECDRRIVEDDQGFVLPGPTGPVVYHQVCFLRTVIPCGMWTEEMLRDLPSYWAEHRRERHPELEGDGR
jgi:hypothetical protein